MATRRRSSGHADRGGYDSGLGAAPARPGGGDRLDADFAWQLGYRLPIIAAVNGACAGVALALVAFCDLRFVVGDRQDHHGRAEARAPGGVRAELDHCPGSSDATRATDLLLSGRVVTGAETADWGLWNAVLPRR